VSEFLLLGIRSSAPGEASMSGVAHRVVARIVW